MCWSYSHCKRHLQPNRLGNLWCNDRNWRIIYQWLPNSNQRVSQLLPFVSSSCSIIAGFEQFISFFLWPLCIQGCIMWSYSDLSCLIWIFMKDWAFNILEDNVFYWRIKHKSHKQVIIIFVREVKCTSHEQFIGVKPPSVH